MQSIKVRHNIEVAHRLSLLPGKCENIHGHSMWVELEIIGPVDDNGVLLEFGWVKERFRHYLDSVYDHRLLLNANDPLLQAGVANLVEPYPGLSVVPKDPTTENIARWVGVWAIAAIGNQMKKPLQFKVSVQETPVNGATWHAEVI